MIKYTLNATYVAQLGKRKNKMKLETLIGFAVVGFVVLALPALIKYVIVGAIVLFVLALLKK